MKYRFSRVFAFAGIAAGLIAVGQTETLGSSPVNSIVEQEVRVSDDQIIAPTATASRDGQSGTTVGCGDGLSCIPSICNGGCRCKSGLLGYGIIKPSEQCFNDFISPVSNPVFFEDPRTLTEVRFLFLNHNLPTALTGNSVQAYAAQIRLALSERLSFIATKDGLVYTQSPLLEPGFLDVAAGFKYNLYRDPSAGQILSVGTTYEIPLGSQKSLQGNGGGEFNFFATGGTRLFGSSRAHWLSAGGLRQPTNENAENRIAYWSNHFNYRLGTNLPTYIFTEFNWWNYLSDGTAFPLAVEGGDIFNLGSVGVTGNDLVTQAVGARIKPRNNIEVGGAFEFPLTERQGLMRDRLTFDLIVRY